MNPPAAPVPRPKSGVASPCTGVCRIAADSGLCEGCRRTLAEIAAWSAMDDGQRLAVWRELRARRRPPSD